MKIEALCAQRLFFYDFGRFLEWLHFFVFGTGKKSNTNPEEPDTLRLLGAGSV